MSVASLALLQRHLGANLLTLNNLRWGTGFGGPQVETFDF
jgi:hypothetical protein